MDIKQDPNSIPHYNGGGRLGEPDRNEPEQSSVLLDADPGDAASAPARDRPSRDDVDGDTPVGSGRDSPLDNGSSASVTPQPPGQPGAGPHPGRARN